MQYIFGLYTHHLLTELLAKLICKCDIILLFHFRLDEVKDYLTKEWKFIKKQYVELMAKTVGRLVPALQFVEQFVKKANDTS